MNGQHQNDPVDAVEDVDGRLYYRILGVVETASTADIKKAFHRLARKLHPDKGGDPASFARLLEAFETLHDPRKRRVYDSLASKLRWRYVPGVTPRAPGGESVILEGMARSGVQCDAATQLVVLCELCWRPSNKQCWTCGMRICDFCTRKQHWKGAFDLHWPLVDSKHMVETLGRRQMEKKREEDARRFEQMDPVFRTEGELEEVRRFKAAAYKSLENPRRDVTYDRELARHWMWDETDLHVYIACHVPTGYSDKHLDASMVQGLLVLQAEDSPALIHRRLFGAVNSAAPFEIVRTEDNRAALLRLPKLNTGEKWGTLFEGDPRGARCMHPSHRVLDLGEAGVAVELDVPFWIDEEDIDVTITSNSVKVHARSTVEGGTLLDKIAFEDKSEKEKRHDYHAIDQGSSTWTLEEDDCSSKTLVIHLPQPPPTEDEVMYRKGKRKDFRCAARPGPGRREGWRFFVDDEDEFSLEDILCAAVFLERGSVAVPPKPWARGTGDGNGAPVWKSFGCLPKEVQRQVEMLLEAWERSEGLHIESGRDGGLANAPLACSLRLSPGSGMLQ